MARSCALGVNDHSHRSRQLTSDDLRDADLIVAMAREHVQFVRRVHPQAAARTATLKRLARDLPAGSELARRAGGGAPPRRRSSSSTWEDVDDPAGGDEAVFHECADEIRDLLDQLAPALLETA